MTGSENSSTGASTAFAAFSRDLERVARSDATVLIQGESGTGKSLAARRLHELGPRSDGVFVEVQVAALAPSLLEAELFGHEEGAFTGAHGTRAGRFQSAAGGTLVLDGIDTLPNELQVKLLRTLQERVVEPLGADRPVAVDVRVIATAVRDLRAEVELGNFREDLYYRLAVVTLEVPPLRTRREDLGELAAALMADVAGRMSASPRPFAAGALERVEAHAWPGNVRELENAIERVIVLGPPNEPVQAEELDFLDEAVAGAAERLAREALAQGLDIDAMSAAMMDAALREQRGNISKAARQVGLSRRAFDYRRSKTKKAGQEGDTA